MRCLAVIVAAIVTALVTAGPIAAQELTDKQLRGLERLGERWDDGDSPGFSVAIARGGKQIYAAGHGRAHLEFDGKIAPDTIFHVASVSKQFTAFALVLLEQDGELSLDDDVRKHVPWLHDFGATITIRHLLNHTSGLRDQWELLAISGYRLDDVLTRDHILAILRAQRELNFAPGSEYMYSNMGYTLAAYVVETVAKKPFHAFCKERIFEPLGMTRTHFHHDHRQVVPGRAYSYALTRGRWHKGVLSYANCGATSLFTTATDLTRWLHNLGAGEVGGKDAVMAMRTRGRLTSGREIRYALGLQVGESRGHTMLQHGGADAGFRSHVIYLPDVDLGVAVLSNAANGNPSLIANGIVQLLVKRRRVAKKPEQPERSAPGANADGPDTDEADAEGPGAAPEVEPIPLAEMAGRYFCPELEVFYEIVVDGDDVKAVHRRHGDFDLQRRGPDTLTGRPFFFRKASFAREDGRVTGFSLTGSRVRNLRFVRVE